MPHSLTYFTSMIILHNHLLNWLLRYSYLTDGEAKALVIQLGKGRCCVGY